jgi:arylformamidase
MHHDAEWLESMYNNRARVPDYADYFARWVQASHAARQSSTCTLDVPYGDGLNETLDVFPASDVAGQSQPVLLFIHGGYWRSLDKADHSFIAPVFTAAGACVVVPNYALCPAVTVPDITQQMEKALAWVQQHIADYGGDPSRITVVGHSAGGHLAAMLMAGTSVTPFKNALSLSGLYELESLRQTPSFQASLQLTPAHVASNSPTYLPAPSQGQLLTVVGGDESAEFIRHNTLIRTAWSSERVPLCETLPGLNHFSIVDALAQPGHRLHQLCLGLLGL